jgi:hypothetical protein
VRAEYGGEPSLSQEGAELELVSERRLELGPQRGDVDAHGCSSALGPQQSRLVPNALGARCGEPHLPPQLRSTHLPRMLLATGAGKGSHWPPSSALVMKQIGTRRSRLLRGPTSRRPPDDLCSANQ